MAQTQLATRIDSRVKKAIVRTCEARGLKIDRFVEDALIEKLEELADIKDINKIRRERTRPLADAIRDLGLERSWAPIVWPLFGRNSEHPSSLFKK